MSESKSFLNSMRTILCLEKRVDFWRILISEQSWQGSQHPAIAAYDVNLLLKHIKHDNSLKSLQFFGHDFKVPLFLDLFKSEYRTQKITPESAIKYVYALSLVDKFNSCHAEALQKELSKIENVSSLSINKHSIFTHHQNTEEKIHSSQSSLII